jgi:hypothetical protein
MFAPNERGSEFRRQLMAALRRQLRRWCTPGKPVSAEQTDLSKDSAEKILFGSIGPE